MTKGTERPPRNQAPGNGRRCRFRELTTVGSPVRGGLKMRSSTAGSNRGLAYAELPELSRRAARCSCAGPI